MVKFMFSSQVYVVWSILCRMVKLLSSGHWSSLCLVVKFLLAGQVSVVWSSLCQVVKFMSSSLVLEKADS